MSFNIGDLFVSTKYDMITIITCMHDDNISIQVLNSSDKSSTEFKRQELEMLLHRKVIKHVSIDM